MVQGHTKTLELALRSAPLQRAAAGHKGVLSILDTVHLELICGMEGVVRAPGRFDPGLGPKSGAIPRREAVHASEQLNL